MTGVTGKIRLIQSVPCANTLGEGVVWDDRQSAALWTDIEERRFFRSVYPFESAQSYVLPQRLGSFGMIETASGRYMGAFESGFACFSLPADRLEWIARPSLAKSARFNDGRVDRRGAFLAGTMIEDEALRAAEPGGVLYKLEDGKASPLLDKIAISNSLCWSPDGATMYFADTPQRTIWAFDYKDGVPENRRVFAATPQGCFPDGSAVDADGYVWNAQWGGARVVRYAPDGDVDLIVDIPAPHVTCVAFGGPSLRHLLVTSARAGLDEANLAAAPESGNLFVYETPFQGLNENRITTF